MVVDHLSCPAITRGIKRANFSRDSLRYRSVSKAALSPGRVYHSDKIGKYDSF